VVHTVLSVVHTCRHLTCRAVVQLCSSCGSFGLVYVVFGMCHASANSPMADQQDYWQCVVCGLLLVHVLATRVL